MHSRSLAGAALHAARAIPAWRRRTEGEERWPVALTTAVAIALQFAVPDRLVLVHPYWVLPAVQGALLIVLVMVNPRKIDRESKALRWLVARSVFSCASCAFSSCAFLSCVSKALRWLVARSVFCCAGWTSCSLFLRRLSVLNRSMPANAAKPARPAKPAIAANPILSRPLRRRFCLARLF